MPDENRVMIAGAGPVGYTAALNLAHYRVPFTLIEAEATLLDDPRTATIHPPTLEMFTKHGQSDSFKKRDYIDRHYHYWDRKTGLVADFDLSVLADDTPYPYCLMLEQHKISKIIDTVLKEKYQEQ